MRRTLPLVLGVALAVGLSATPASAHAAFEQGSVPADSDTEITMSVRKEEAKAHTAEVVVELPEGFEIVSCSVKPGWSCTAVPAAQGTDVAPAPDPAHDDKDGHHAHSADGHDDDGDKQDGDKKDGDAEDDHGQGGEKPKLSGATVTFNRTSDQTVETVDVFTFVVRSPATAGDYVFPVHQTYSNQKHVAWAPALKVE